MPYTHNSPAHDSHTQLHAHYHDDISTNLLAPLRLGDEFELSHRVVLAPVTRCRALHYVPQPAHVKYYGERTTPGGLLITEGAAICQQGIGFPHSPGIWSEEQLQAWSEVVQAVHDRGGYIFCQLWHVGRASHTYYQPDGELSLPVSSTSTRVPQPWSIRLPEGTMSEYSKPRALHKHEIPMVVQQFQQAARNAKCAGFDGVEIHCAHGYLVDQFLKDGINNRDDEYGGSVENRCRFALEVIEAVAEEMGEQRTAVRISPIIDHLGATDSNPRALGLHLISHLNDMNLAYLHVTEPRFTNQGLKPSSEDDRHDDLLLLLREAFKGKMMLSGGYDRRSGMDAIRSGVADLISYGRLFISNPDLPLRFAIEAGLNAYDRSTFYTHDQVKGYLDYNRLSSDEVEQGWARRREESRTDQKGRRKQLLRVHISNKCGPAWGGASGALLPSSPATPIAAGSPRP
ncbi:hypothetical protein GOP47_0019000 [Adiantum capillus-veneris]|uniref:NADH:flavin oxidoreductase/NADH oxidase N-terminal domain-containing protein n=1 Tax=Adiantum capillus-veneris TaxID=13818 RepID=A0A9D4UFN0_ADICA|nr:hypothetical protein GOP47_0019000 [Adiantum capillus-veneris]